MSQIVNDAKKLAKSKYFKNLKDLSSYELHDVISYAVMSYISDDWKKSRDYRTKNRTAFYFSAEFLVGRAIYNNLVSKGLYDEVEKELNEYGVSLKALEDVEDAALGNGGLGRLAACFLDSAATLDIPLDGYGIRYKYGLFKQDFHNGFQIETADDWTKWGDPWSVRCESDIVTVDFKDMSVKAVPYDMPIIGYGTDNIGTLRLWQSESLMPFDFDLFNAQKYDKSVALKNRAEDISRVLYPNDDNNEGKRLRLKQQYFFSSASLQDIIRKYKRIHSNDFSKFADFVTIQLNDTHPVISIPELIRLLTVNENVKFENAVEICKNVFNYTNHTIMQEALEKWDLKLIRDTIPQVLDIIKQLDKMLKKELKDAKFPKEKAEKMQIIQEKRVHMAYLAIFCSKYVNGVARIHTDILKTDVLKDWYELYPEKFQNKTNGITQRRWLLLCNRELSAFITELLGSDEWVTDLDKLKELEKYADDENVLNRFISIKEIKKKQLVEYIKVHDGVEIDENTIFDIQIKRLHEYKRQLLNALAILELYFEIKEGTLTDFTPTTFIFGAKSAPGYARAKGIIKLINEIAKLIEKDDVVSKYIKVVFVKNYNVSYAEKLVAAADVSEQISTAGTEASGTGNMKLMLNGAVTLGTYDGANIEIVEEAGEENNYIFGARVEDIEDIKETYSSKEIYENDEKIKRVLDALVDGTLKDGKTKIFKDLYDSLLKGASWHEPDHYYLLLDFNDYVEIKKKVNNDYKNKQEFYKKCWLNMCNAGKFSSDRTIKEYAKEIWHI
ncbi:MAG: glycogen/starch/alpha-glucan phosphorylase [Clostridia bacterium]|nr:glycogen/starch/alpha-glucan phosphorylase [Clostridia bacterium]